MTHQELKDAIRQTGAYFRLVQLWNEASEFVELRRVVILPHDCESGLQAFVELSVGQGASLWYVDLELTAFYGAWWMKCVSEHDSFACMVDEAKFDEIPWVQLARAAAEAFREDTVEAAERVRAAGARLIGDLENRRRLINALLDTVQLSRKEITEIINTRVVNEVMTS